MSAFDKFKEEFPNKEKPYSSMTNKGINDKEEEHVPNAWNKFDMKTIKDGHEF